jgi:hypothetical protein
MNEDGFRAFLGHRLGHRSVSSYISNARRVETVLKVDLDDATRLNSLDQLEDRLRRAADEFTAGSLADCLTALRTYFRYINEDGGPSPAARSDGVPVRASAHEKGRAQSPANHRPAILREASIRELLALHGGIIAELRDRQVVRTGNGPLGDYAEYLFSRAFGWKLTDNSSSGYDATHEGVRYQIKGRRISSSNPSRQLGAIRRLPEAPFDVLAAVLFDEDYSVIKGILIPHSLALERARHVAHTNSWRLMLDDRWWALPGITDVTSKLRAEQAEAIVSL